MCGSGHGALGMGEWRDWSLGRLGTGGVDVLHALTIWMNATERYRYDVFENHSVRANRPAMGRMRDTYMSRVMLGTPFTTFNTRTRKKAQAQGRPFPPHHTTSHTTQRQC